MVAAKAARMRCIAVPDHALAHDRRFQAADAILPSLEAFDPAALDRWIEEWADRP